MSKKRDIYNKMNSEDPFAEDYSAYYGEEVPEPEENGQPEPRGGYIDDEAEEEDPYADYPYPEDGPYDYIDPYDPRLQEYLMSNGYMRQRRGGGRYADFESDESVSSSSSDSESPSPSDSSSEESSDSSSEERVTRRKPKKTFRAKAKAKKGKQNGRKKKK